MVVIGGVKAPNLFLTWKEELEEGDDIADLVMYEITDRLGVKVIQQDERVKGIKRNIQNWKNIKAKTLVEEIIYSGINLIDIQRAGAELISLSKGERGGNEYS